MARWVVKKYNRKGVIRMRNDLSRGIILYCEYCRVEFKVWIEPSHPVDTVISEFPDSFKWLHDIRDGLGRCPVCRGKLEVRDTANE